jgi:hypothetical protein
MFLAGQHAIGRVQTRVPTTPVRSTAVPATGRLSGYLAKGLAARTPDALMLAVPMPPKTACLARAITNSVALSTTSQVGSLLLRIPGRGWITAHGGWPTTALR